MGLLAAMYFLFSSAGHDSCLGTDDHANKHQKTSKKMNIWKIVERIVMRKVGPRTRTSSSESCFTSSGPSGPSGLSGPSSATFDRPKASESIRKPHRGEFGEVHALRLPLPGAFV